MSAARRPQRLRRNALALAVLATLAAHGRADAADADAGTGAPAPDAPSQLGRVEVVGSRIKRVDIETSQPVLVLERVDIERTGLISVGDILQQIVVHGEGLNSRVNNGNDGKEQVSLRNLGPNRTLVLVNGRRWVDQLDGSVDLSTIPLAMVERVEVLKDGASAIYGSDAIAGVVNITMRNHYDGAEAHAYFGEYAHGDGRSEVYDFTLGADHDRGSVAISTSYQKQEPVFAGDRTISSVPTYGLPENDACAGASATTPNGRFIVPGQPLTPRDPCTRQRYGSTLIDGRPGTSPDDFRLFDAVSDGYNFAPLNYLQTPSERTALFGQGRYDLGGALTFTSDLLYSERRSEQLLAPSPVAISPAIAGAQGNVGISADNLYNPFGVDILRFARRFIESGGRLFDQDVANTRFSAGLDGAFTLFEHEFSWEAHGMHSSQNQNSMAQGGLDFQNVANALGPSFIDPQGVPRCGVPGDVISGCVPLDVFGGAGTITPAMGGYIQATAHDSQSLDLTSYAFNLTGDLFQLPAGPLGFAGGYEYRRESGSFEPDALVAAGRLANGGGSAQSTAGSYSVSEAYVELNLPLLADKPYAEVLELSLAARYSDYSNFGSTINAKAGFRWKPYADLLLRGNWSQGFRAPSVAELFTGTQLNGGGDLVDPCHPGTSSPPDVLARCAAAGVPSDFALPEFTNISDGGNPELLPETAVTRTLGLVYSPSWAPGLDLYLDWYDITIDEVIEGLDGQTIVNRCYVLADPFACARVTRNADHQLFLVDATLQNVHSGFETEGYDFTLSWRHPTPYGRFEVRWDTAYVDYIGDQGRPARLSATPDGTLLLGNVIATRDDFGDDSWRIKSNLTLGWSRGDWSASITGRYFSPLEETCQRQVDFADTRGAPQYRDLCTEPDRIVDLDGDGIGDPAAIHEIAAVWFFDLQAGWDAPWHAHVTVGLRNAFDRDPPVSLSTFANSFLPSYDLPGRFWYAEYTQHF